MGSAVTRNRPLRPGFDVTSMSATLMFKSFDQSANEPHALLRSLQAGHHGAKLKLKRKRNLIKLWLTNSCIIFNFLSILKPKYCNFNYSLSPDVGNGTLGLIAVSVLINK